jgi:Flp pilus assembly protein TadG
LLFAFFGLVALAVDIGVIATAKAQLQTVADAAALAGARQLVSPRRLSSTITDLTPEMQKATDQAITIGQRNSVLGQAVVITSSDVAFGYLDPTIPSDTLHTDVNALQYNSVQVTATRSSDHVGVVPAFFSSLLGYGGSTISVTSTATANLYQIKGYHNFNSLNANIVPFALSITRYNAMINNTTADNYTFTPSNISPPGSVTPGPDGIYESENNVLENVNINWSTFYFTGSNGSESPSIVNSEIENGVPPSLLSSAPTSYSATPGINAATSDDTLVWDKALKGIIGYPVAVPIYDPANLEIAYYAVVRFVKVNLPGTPPNEPPNVIVQPAVGDDPTAIPSTNTTPNPWTQGGQIVLHLSR